MARGEIDLALLPTGLDGKLPELLVVVVPTGLMEKLPESLLSNTARGDKFKLRARGELKIDLVVAFVGVLMSCGLVIGELVPK